MASKKKKYYVVWLGVKPGIYQSWDECKKQVEGYNNAKYKSYETLHAAEQAFKLGYSVSLGKQNDSYKQLTADYEHNAIAVDAACSGNPGVMEYRGVYVETGTELFHYKSDFGTNNIGEFLAIVHGLAYLKNNRLSLPMYSDSRNAINWVRQKVCRTKLPFTEKSEKLYDVIHRAERWLEENDYTTQILKWDTERWGEIPADFGRK